MDQKATQQILVQLAAAAADTSLTVPGLKVTLPESWKLLTTKSAFTPTVGNAQFLLAYGNVGEEVIACLAVGLPWQNLLGTYSNGFQKNDMHQLPEEVAGKTTEDQTVMGMYVSAYQFIRTAIWESFAFLDDPNVKGKPLYITGMGLGAALSQIVALDLRPGNKGPNQQLPPQTSQPPSYVFSAGNFASTAFETYYASLVTGATNTTAGTAALPVDRFPDAPSSALDFASLGAENLVQASVPTPYYTPWEVRDSNFYLKTLGGTPVPAIPTKTNISNPPSGFSQSLAFNLGKYVELNYKQGLQPDTPAPVDMVKLFNYGDTPAIAAIFKTANSIVVTFRGSITYEEFLGMDANSRTAVNPENEQITSGTQTLLYELPANQEVTTKGKEEKDPNLNEQIIAEIENIRGELKLYIAGHGFGGALANAFALGLSQIKPQAISVDAIYTFGANYFAGANTASTFKSLLSTVSFQILRPQDTVATALKTFRFWFPADNTVSLDGTLDQQEDTSHSLSSYLELLDPTRVQPS